MDKLVLLLKGIIDGKLGNIVLALCSVVSKMLEYLAKKNDSKADKEDKEKIQQEKQKIDDTCNNGTLDDLLDLADKA